MRDEVGVKNRTRVERSRDANPSPVLVLCFAAFVATLSAAVCAAAILTPAPPGAVPLVVAVCLGCPLFAAANVPGAVFAVRARRSGTRALATLRRHLAQLPETEHPLGM